MDCSTRPRIFQRAKSRAIRLKINRDYRGNTHHCVLGAKVVDDEGAANSSGHIKQTAEKSMRARTGRLPAAYLITVAQPNTALSEVLLPMMLQRE
jgi:hypothetical protein